ncbi:MAG: SH3 domain-containing protein [archaeon]|nr:SH3 domain-containing protein [archaeon]
MAAGGSLLLKVQLTPMSSKLMKFSESGTAGSVIDEICRTNKFSHPDSYYLFRPAKQGWLKDKEALVRSFEFEAKETVLFLSRYQPVAVLHGGKKQLVLVDFVRPLHLIMSYILRKFKLDGAPAGYSLFHKERATTLDSQASLLSQNVDPNYSTLSLQCSGEQASSSSSGGPSSSSSSSHAQSVDTTAALAQLQDIVKQGPLTKANRKKKWERRWFALSQDHLFYYKSQGDPHPSGFVPLSSFQIRTAVDAKKRVFQFELFSSDIPAGAKRALYPIRCPDEASMNQWIAVLQPVTGRPVIKEGEEPNAPKKVFGGKLEDACDAGKVIPYVVLDAIQYIETKALQVEGIFRLSGSAPKIQQYIAQYNLGERANFATENDPHTVCGVMKQFFRDMEEPILTYELYADFMAADAAGKWDLALKLGYLRHLLSQLPSRNRETLTYLFEFLQVVARHSSANQMAFHNLATVFGPNLLKSRGTNMLALVSGTAFINSITHTMLENFEAVFKNGPMPQPAPADADKEPAPGAAVVFDFPGTNPHELPLQTGDLVHVFHKDADGWWRGESNGRYGRFPGQYVKLLSAVAMARGIKKQAYERKMHQLKQAEADERTKIQALKESLAEESAKLAAKNAQAQASLATSQQVQATITQVLGPFYLGQCVNQLISSLAESSQDFASVASLEENLLTEVGSLHKALLSITTTPDPKKVKKDKKAQDTSHIELVRDNLLQIQTKLQAQQQAHRQLHEHRKVVLADLTDLSSVVDSLGCPITSPDALSTVIQDAKKALANTHHIPVSPRGASVVSPRGPIPPPLLSAASLPPPLVTAASPPSSPASPISASTSNPSDSPSGPAHTRTRSAKSSSKSGKPSSSSSSSSSKSSKEKKSKSSSKETSKSSSSKKK